MLLVLVDCVDVVWCRTMYLGGEISFFFGNACVSVVFMFFFFSGGSILYQGR